MKHAGHISGITFVTGLFFSLVYLEIWFLDLNPPQLPEGLNIEQWKASFQKWAFVCVGAAGFASLIWYGLAQWTFKINRWEDAGKRPWWIFLFFFPITAIILSVIFVERAQSGLRFEQCVFFLINGLLSYYLATSWFSPSSFKYTPAGAKYVRHW